MLIQILSQLYICSSCQNGAGQPEDSCFGGYSDWLTKILVFMGCCAILKVGLSWYRNLILQKLSGHMNLDFGNQFLIHMLRLPISFFDQRSAGDMVSRMDNNSEINSMGKFFSCCSL